MTSSPEAAAFLARSSARRSFDSALRDWNPPTAMAIIDGSVMIPYGAGEQEDERGEGDHRHRPHRRALRPLREPDGGTRDEDGREQDAGGDGRTLLVDQLGVLDEADGACLLVDLLVLFLDGLEHRVVAVDLALHLHGGEEQRAPRTRS